MFKRCLWSFPGLPWSACTPFLISSSSCSCAVFCAAVVEDVLAECLSFWLLCIHFLLTGDGEEKRVVEHNVKNREL